MISLYGKLGCGLEGVDVTGFSPYFTAVHNTDRDVLERRWAQSIETPGEDPYLTSTPPRSATRI